MEATASPGIKPVIWIGTTRADLSRFPEEVKDAIGYALYMAQRGDKHPDAKPLRGFGGAGILEIVVSHAGDAYRAVYTVRLAGKQIRRADVENPLLTGRIPAERSVRCGRVDCPANSA